MATKKLIKIIIIYIFFFGRRIYTLPAVNELIVMLICHVQLEKHGNLGTISKLRYCIQVSPPKVPKLRYQYCYLSFNSQLLIGA